MPTEAYLTRNPGDLLTAEDWNDLQVKIKADIAGQVQSGIQAITTVPNAQNALKLENKSAEEWAQEIVRRALQQIPERTGYQKLFKRLKPNEEKVIEHGLEACPLVDVYALDTFEVVCSEDEQKNKASVNFFLYHSSEKKLRHTTGGTTEVFDIEPTDGTPPFRIAFAEMLALYEVQYTDDTSLDDLENEFWKAFFAAPNDEFDDDKYCHSPWFDKCCCDNKTVADLKKRGDWDDLWLQMRPKKVIDYNTTATTTNRWVPQDVQIVHFDFNTLGMTWTHTPGANDLTELPVMVLLKV